MTTASGRVGVADQALAVPAEPVARLGPSGFDPSRIPYRPFDVEAGQVWRSQGYAMFIDHVADERGDPTVELWRFAGEDDYEEGFGWLEVRLHEIVETERSGTLAVYFRQWFDPNGEPAWGNRPKRTIGAVGSLKALIRRRKMKLLPASGIEARSDATPQSGAAEGESPSDAQSDPAINAVEAKSQCWDLDLAQNAYDLIADAVGDSREGFSLVNFNDAPERTQAEVIDAFRKAAELARGEQSAMGRAG